MLNNLKIGVRLAIGFAVTLALLITISVIGVTRIAELNSNVNDLVKVQFPKTVVASEIVANIAVVGRHLRNVMIYSGPEQQRSIDSLAETRKKITADLETLDRVLVTEKGKALLAKVKTARALYVTSQDKALELIKADKKAEAVALFQGDLRKGQTEFIKAMDELNTFLNEHMESVGQKAEDASNAATRMLTILAVVAAVLSALLGFLITRSITRPVGEAVDAAKKMAVGDFNFKLDNNHKDEVGEVVRAVAAVQHAVQAMTADANMLSQAAVEGKLATRADAAKHQGDFQKIVAGVNGTLDAVIGPLNVAAGYVDRISKGDIPARITDTYNGDFNVLKNNLNTCIDAVNALVADAVMLSKAAVEGKLATRADASKHQGDFLRIVAGVNDTLDAVIGPLNVAAGYVDRISKGDIPARITDTYNGDFNVLKNNLNTCIDAVNALVADAVMLSAAAVEGRLETRADASKHQGDFQRIVTGVNDTLDNVVGPINEVRQLMGAMSNGDLSQTITTSYRGDFDELKNAINQTVVKLVGIIGEVRTAADNLTNAAGQVSATAQSLSQSSSEQAASVEETTSSMEQMTASISQNTENAKVTDGMAAKAAKEAAEGGEAVTRTVDDMKSIASKIGIIDDIAYQTNLLALNAAIEAARAGDHGKGFAVVAAEVRKLAERSQVAAQEIGNLASSSVKQAERAGTLLTEMVPTIRKTSDLVQEIASASSEQSSGVGQINGAMSQLNQATQQNASASEELAATAEELGAQAEQLQQTMTFFHLDDSQRHVAQRSVAASSPAHKAKATRPSARSAAVQINEGDFERY